jgi:hypothetical protein
MPSPFIPWNDCIAALNDVQLKDYAQWRDSAGNFAFTCETSND